MKKLSVHIQKKPSPHQNQTIMDVSIASIDTLLTSGCRSRNILIIKINELKTTFEISKSAINENYIKIVVDI